MGYRERGITEFTVSDLSQSLVSRGDIARMAGVRPDTVRVWIRRDLGFPAAVVRTSGGRLWLRSEVERWLRETGRM